MPKGVEHAPIPSTGNATSDCVESLMPKGVEHAQQELEGAFIDAVLNL